MRKEEAAHKWNYFSAIRKSVGSHSRRDPERSLSPFAQFMLKSWTRENSPSRTPSLQAGWKLTRTAGNAFQFVTKMMNSSHGITTVYRSVVPERRSRQRRSDSLASLDAKAEKWARGVRNWHFLYQCIKKFRILNALRKITLLKLKQHF